MELQFHKSQCQCLQQLKREMQTQEQTQELRLPDSMPDIGSVLGAWGQVLVRSKEWRSGSMQVSGGVMTWVLYLPEDGDQPQCVDTWIPFQLRWDLSDCQEDGKIWVDCLLRSVDARSTSARKLMVRATVGAVGEAFVRSQVDVYRPDALPDDICVLKKSYPVRLPVEAGEKVFDMEEEVTLPGTCPTLQELLRFHLQPEIAEWKVLADKAVFRGSANLHVLYRTEDGKLCSWDFELPFSQYAELDRDYEPTAIACILPAVTSLELDMDPESRLHLKAGLIGQYVIYDSMLVEVAEDAYSPRRTVQPQMEMLQLPSVLDTRNQTLHAEQTVSLQGGKIVDVTCCPDHAHVQREENAVQVRFPAQFQMLYYDDNGILQNVGARWEEQLTLPADDSSEVNVAVKMAGAPQGSVSAGQGTVRTDLTVDAWVWAGQGIPMATAAEMGELEEPDPARPSLILRRAGEQSLWDMAKDSGSTVEAIWQVNGLTGEPDSQQMLLIPVL